MDSEDRLYQVNLQVVIPQMMEEILKLKAEKNAMFSMIGFLMQRIGFEKREQEQFISAYVDLSKEEYDRLRVEHPWMEAYWKDKLGGITDANG